jgi:5'-nucleotidase
MSHLGYYESPREGQIGDVQLVERVDGIDFIASGHTHTFMEQPVIAKQPGGGQTTIFQVGKSGIYVGRVDFTIRAGKVASVTARLLDLRDVA